MFTEKITSEIKNTLDGFDERKMRDHMLKHYKLWHLIDDKEKWATPELQKISTELLPRNMTKKKSQDFIDEMALLAEKNTYLVNFLKKVKNEKFEHLFEKVRKEGGHLFPDLVAYTSALDRLTKAIYENPKILQQCVDLFKKERRQISFFKHESFFRKMKLLSVEKPIVESIILKSHRTQLVQGKAGHMAAFVNIMEATVADIIEGNSENAKVGWILAINKPGSKKYNPHTGAGPSIWADDKKTILLRPPLPKEWADLYQTWNMAFVAQSQSFPYLIPKLLIPQVANYHENPAQYLHKRVLALYLCLNYLIFDCANRMGADIPAVHWDEEELAHFWGMCNLESARKYTSALFTSK
ncbi:MAG: hypothetical protein Q8L47_04630 [bacterium]|nr:hypothetical protein [bacterium]